MTSRIEVGGLLAVAMSLLPPLTAQTTWNTGTLILPMTGPNVAVYDAPTQRAIVVFLNANETWSLDSATGSWTQLSSASGGPWYRSDPAIAHDPVRNRTVLFGGRDPWGNVLADTWEFDGTSWQQHAGGATPPARHNAGMCYDSVTGVVRLVGGDGSNFGMPPMPRADSWAFDGVQWTPQPGPFPQPSGATAMAFDSDRGRCVALASNGTFESVAGTMVQVATGTSPPARSSTGLSYDSFRQRILVFGGNDTTANSLGDVWEYDGGNWTQRFPTGQLVTPRGSHGVVFDPLLRVVRVFAGLRTITRPSSTTGIVLADEIRYGPVSPAATTVFASTCYFSVPLLVDGPPWLGATVNLTTPVSTPTASAILAIGFSNQVAAGRPLPVPLAPYGFGSCELLVSPNIVFFATASAGSVSFPITAPNRQSLAGVRLYAQALELIPFGTSTATVGVTLQLGGR